MNEMERHNALVGLQRELQFWKTRYTAKCEQAWICFCIGLFGLLLGLALMVMATIR